ncbi:AMP-dependent synthetase/ligase [Luteipulveratus flavus]|uniref:Long-chain fatty acid--CoA ligase n=1 Tax=Luteipulveratus flavus TaxID=3031728 RepID=A0ABT6C4S7_9MICO|nr:long-chain fatty acid--CoA ligase [Luteipulveratus sp. YIM 133296]MDF8263312.1 long-chain fatty acid--CoA ligase [Luteipulveratus sp. YIM 133296]
MAMSLNDEQYDQSVVDQRAQSVAHLFVDRVAASSGEKAFGHPDGEGWSWLTWAQVDERVRRIGAGLVTLGVEPQDRVAIASSTRLEWVLADLAVMLAAGATTTIYPTTTAEDVQYILADSGSKVVFAENDEQATKLRTLRESVADVRKVVLFDGEGDGDWVIGLADLEAAGAQLLSEQPDVLDARIAGIGSQDLSTLIYTSGTTGRPKGVQLPHDAWAYEAAAVDATGLLDQDDLQFLWLPLAHVFGKMLLTLPLQIGFPTAIDGRVDKIIENLPVVKPTWMGAAPRIFEKVYGRITTMMADEGGAKAKMFDWASGVATDASNVRADGGKPGGALALKHSVADKLVLHKIRDRFGGRVRFFISGSAALNPDVARWFDAMGLPILEGYGLTETSAAAFVNRPYPGANQIGTVGWPLPGTEVKIAEDGEILVKGPGVMQGYRGLDDATAEALVDGWLHTGDIGELLPTGHLRITDRKKDLFKTSNGKYVAPSVIESLFKGICPYASQLVIEGDGRKFVSALVTLDEDGIVEWGAHHGMQDADYQTIVTSDACRAMVQGHIDELNTKLNRWEQIKRFIILPRDLTIEDGEITPSLKLKRKVVTGKYRTELDGLYVD